MTDLKGMDIEALRNKATNRQLLEKLKASKNNNGANVTERIIHSFTQGMSIPRLRLGISLVQ